MLLPSVSSSMVCACPVLAQGLGAQAPRLVEQDSRSGRAAGQTLPLQPSWRRRIKNMGTENIINTGKGKELFEKGKKPRFQACLVYLGAGEREERH